MTNASQVKVTGRKADQILYRKHTLYPGGLKEIKYRDMMSKKPDEVRRSLVSLKCHLLTGKAPRLSEKRSRACCQKINFVNDDWRGYGYLRVQTWAFFRKTFSSDGRMGPSTVPNRHETTLRFSKDVVDRWRLPPFHRSADQIPRLFILRISYGNLSLCGQQATYSLPLHVECSLRSTCHRT